MTAQTTDASMFNEEAEQALLGALLMDDAAYGHVVGSVSAEHFYFPAHAAIFQAIDDLAQQDKPCGFLAVSQALAERKDPDYEAAGGKRYLSELAGSIVDRTGPGLKGYVWLIREAHARRQFRAALDLAAECLESGGRDGVMTLAEIIGETMAAIEKIDTGAERAKTNRQVALQIVDEYGKPKKVYPTGFRQLDEAMGGGLYAGKSYAILAMEKRGKTALAGSISDNLNQRGVKHAYVALEMGAADIERRKAARHLGVKGGVMLNPPKDVARQVAKYACEVPESTVYIDMPSGTFRQLRAELAKAVSRHKITGFIVDYWQLVTGKDKQHSTEEHLRTVANWIDAFCKKHGLWAIVLGQLNDDGKGLQSHRGLHMACEQTYVLHRENIDQPFAWLEMQATRYTALLHVGSPEDPALYLEDAGPHYREM